MTAPPGMLRQVPASTDQVMPPLVSEPLPSMLSERSDEFVTRPRVIPASSADSEQVQLDCPLEGRRARRHPEFAVDRPQVGLHRVA